MPRSDLDTLFRWTCFVRSPVLAAAALALALGCGGGRIGGTESTGGAGHTGGNSGNAGGTGNGGNGGNAGSAGDGGSTDTSIDTITGGAGGSTGTTSSTDTKSVPTARQQVLDYIASVNAAHRTIAGQHDKYNDDPAVSTSWISDHTGKKPGLWSADFGFGDSQVQNRGKMIEEAKKQWSQGAIVQIMYHNCIPTRDELCDWDEIGGNNPQHLSDSEWNDLVTDGTDLNKAWKARLDTLSVHFADLKAAGVAPLFRPLHEMNQPVFWWAGRGGENGTRKLYQITHDYLVGTKGFDNIVWVWDLQDFGSLQDDVTAYNPGPAYHDIAALDIYDGGYDQWKYDAMVGAVGKEPIAIGECEHVPSADELSSQPRWSFFMLWPDFLDENAGQLPGLYGAPNVVTLDQMPGWK